MNRSTVGIEKSFYYEFLKKRQNKKPVYPRYTASYLTKITIFYYINLLRFGGHHFFKEPIKKFLQVFEVLRVHKKTLIECRVLLRVLNPLKR